MPLVRQRSRDARGGWKSECFIREGKGKVPVLVKYHSMKMYPLLN
jgi:hypothetical protein